MDHRLRAQRWGRIAAITRYLRIRRWHRRRPGMRAGFGLGSWTAHRWREDPPEPHRNDKGERVADPWDILQGNAFIDPGQVAAEEARSEKRRHLSRQRWVESGGSER